MTGEHGHRNDITNGQLINRHADRPYVFYFFPTAFFKNNFMPARKRHIGSCPNRTSQHTGKIQRAIFCPGTKDRLAYENLYQKYGL